jgi:hypothetical protein
LIRCLILLVTLIAAPFLLRADGGTLILRQRSGTLNVSVFASPSPLRAGPADFSLLIQNAETEDVLLDGEVELNLSKAGFADIIARATPGQATNRLLYAATVNIPEPGEWKVSALCRVRGQDVRLGGSIAILPPAPPLFTYWPYFLVPPVAIGLFLLNQALKKKRRSLKITSAG